MTDMREIEAKFEIDPESVTRLTFLNSIGQFNVVSRRHVLQDDLYFDTVDGALSDARSSLRVRLKASGAQMTFKGHRDDSLRHGEEHIASRLEDEVALDDETAKRMLSGDWGPSDERLTPVVRARQLTGDDRLHPIARLRNTRVVVDIIDGKDQTIEMAIDTCEGTRLSDGRVTRFNELELEVKRASRESLINVATELQEMLPGIRPNHRTKLERVLQ
jgi:inorganic triphosphatase YgiF